MATNRRSSYASYGPSVSSLEPGTSTVARISSRPEAPVEEPGVDHSAPHLHPINETTASSPLVSKVSGRGEGSRTQRRSSYASYALPAADQAVRPPWQAHSYSNPTQSSTAKSVGPPVTHLPEDTAAAAAVFNFQPVGRRSVPPFEGSSASGGGGGSGGGPCLEVSAEDDAHRGGSPSRAGPNNVLTGSPDGTGSYEAALPCSGDGDDIPPRPEPLSPPESGGSVDSPAVAPSSFQSKRDSSAHQRSPPVAFPAIYLPDHDPVSPDTSPPATGGATCERPRISAGSRSMLSPFSNEELQDGPGVRNGPEHYNDDHHSTTALSVQDEAAAVEKLRAAARLQMYQDHAQYQGEQRLRHLEVKIRRANSFSKASRSPSLPRARSDTSDWSMEGTPPPLASQTPRVSPAQQPGGGDSLQPGGIQQGRQPGGSDGEAEDDMTTRVQLLKRELSAWQLRLDASVARCQGALEATEGMLEVETGRLRSDMAAVAADADTRVRASADAVAAAIAAAPKVPALLDAIEKELAAEEVGLSMGSTAPDAKHVLPLNTAQPVRIPTAVQPALATAAKEAVVQQQDGDSMSPERGTLMTGRGMLSSSPTRAPGGV